MLICTVSSPILPLFSFVAFFATLPCDKTSSLLYLNLHLFAYPSIRSSVAHSGLHLFHSFYTRAPRVLSLSLSLSIYLSIYLSLYLSLFRPPSLPLSLSLSRSLSPLPPSPSPAPALPSLSHTLAFSHRYLTLYLISRSCPPCTLSLSPAHWCPSLVFFRVCLSIVPIPCLILYCSLYLSPLPPPALSLTHTHTLAHTYARSLLLQSDPVLHFLGRPPLSTLSRSLDSVCGPLALILSLCISFV